MVRVELDLEGKEVTVKVNAGPSPFSCPECEAMVPGYDRKSHRWRHLDTCQFAAWIEAGIRMWNVSPQNETGWGALGRSGQSVQRPVQADGHRLVQGVLCLRRSNRRQPGLRAGLYLAEGRKAESLNEFWRVLTPAERRSIEAIAMDMWEPYIQSTRQHVPGAEAKIVFDRFYIAKHLDEAVEKVRRAEHQELKGMADARLTGTKYLSLMRPQDMSPE